MDDLLKLKVSELKKKCKDLGLSIIGNKGELTKRLQEFVIKGGDDTVLNEAELLGELDGSDSQVVSNVDEDLLLGDSISESRDETSDKNESNEIVISEPVEKPEEAKDDEETGEPPAKVVKTDSVSTKTAETPSPVQIAEQKMQERAARFGIITSSQEQDKKTARAQRFGLTTEITNGDVTVDIEKLKKREQRFGGSVSDKLKIAAEEEKKKMRAERFGIQESEQKPKTTMIATNAEEEKKSMRAARFGVGVDDEKKKARAARFGK